MEEVLEKEGVMSVRRCWRRKEGVMSMRRCGGALRVCGGGVKGV